MLTKKVNWFGVGGLSSCTDMISYEDAEAALKINFITSVPSPIQTYFEGKIERLLRQNMLADVLSGHIKHARVSTTS